MSGGHQPKKSDYYYEGGGSLDDLNANLVNTWTRQLTPESEQSAQRARKLSSLPLDDISNKTKRRVFHGHYVLVKPTGLPQPKMIMTSLDVASNLLGLGCNHDDESTNATTSILESNHFLEYVSGNRTLQESWATPYALSIMGDRYTDNCPFATGDGYGVRTALCFV